MRRLGGGREEVRRTAPGCGVSPASKGIDVSASDLNATGRPAREPWHLEWGYVCSLLAAVPLIGLRVL